MGCAIGSQPHQRQGRDLGGRGLCPPPARSGFRGSHGSGTRLFDKATQKTRMSRHEALHARRYQFSLCLKTLRRRLDSPSAPVFRIPSPLPPGGGRAKGGRCPESWRQGFGMECPTTGLLGNPLRATTPTSGVAASSCPAGWSRLWRVPALPPEPPDARPPPRPQAYILWAKGAAWPEN